MFLLWAWLVFQNTNFVAALESYLFDLLSGTIPKYPNTLFLAIKATLIKWHNRHGIQKVRRTCCVAK